MFFAVPGRNPAWASPPKGEAGPGSAVLVIGARLAGADRGRLLAWSGRFMRRDIFVVLGCPWRCLLPFGAAHSAKLIS